MSSFSITSDLKLKLNNMPKDAKDFNNMCSLIYGEYTFKLNVLKALLRPVTTMHALIDDALDALNLDTFMEIMNALLKLLTILHDNFPNQLPKDRPIDKDTVRFGNLLAKTCPSFFASVPTSMFGLMHDVEYGLVETVDNMLTMPRSLALNLAHQLSSVLNDALVGALSTVMIAGVSIYDLILSPLIAYEEFLRDNGISKLITNMAGIEQCMMKKGICNRPFNDFKNPANNKLWSKHFRDEFRITTRGKVDIKKFLPTDALKLTYITEIQKNLEAYRSISGVDGPVEY